jgi:hypothetical protein
MSLGQSRTKDSVLESTPDLEPGAIPKFLARAMRNILFQSGIAHTRNGQTVDEYLSVLEDHGYEPSANAKLHRRM